MKKSKYLKRFLPVIFCLYIGFVIWITIIHRESGERCFVLTPFWEYAKVINNDRRSYFIGQIAGNILLLMPLGFLLPFLPKFKGIRLIKVLIYAMCFSVLIELIQFITCRGITEFDDVFNNTAGAAFGYGINQIVCRILHKK